MAVVFIAIGSRGDVQPLAVLAGELAHRGVTTRVIALAEYAHLISRLGGEPVPIASTLDRATGRADTTLGRVAMSWRAGQAAILQRWLNEIAELAAEAIDAAVAPGDAVVASIMCRDIAQALVAGRQCRMATVLYSGQLPTLHPESHYMPDLFTRSAGFNRWGAYLNWTIASTLGRPIADRLRARMGLIRPSRRQSTRAADRHPTIMAASPIVVPPAPDWPAGTYQTGYLAMPRLPGLPEAELVDFLAAGSAPVYVGFGSMAAMSRHGVELLIDAARIARRRIVAPTIPGTRPGKVDDRVLLIGPTPHGWLLPRMAGIVHHGGAGTTHEGLRAGIPSVAVPFGVDQPYHAARLHELGVGPAPVPLKQLSARTLAGTLRALTGQRYQLRAAELGHLLREEDAVAGTVQLMADLDLIPTQDPTA